MKAVKPTPKILRNHGCDPWAQYPAMLLDKNNSPACLVGGTKRHLLSTDIEVWFYKPRFSKVSPVRIVRFCAAYCNVLEARGLNVRCCVLKKDDRAVKFAKTVGFDVYNPLYDLYNGEDLYEVYLWRSS